MRDVHQTDSAAVFILSPTEFIALWRDFQHKSSQLLKKRSSNADNMEIIVWNSDLTKEKYIDYGLPKKDYTIQFWGDASVSM